MPGIVWLASYPRSGNTWLRLLVAAYRRGAAAVADFAGLAAMPIACARAPFDAAAGVDTGELTAEEVDLLRPRVYARMAAAADVPPVVKVHDAYRANAAGEPCFPPSATAGVVYAVRDPLDVAVSFAHLLDVPLDRAVDMMCREDAALGATTRAGTLQLREDLGSWATHARSWLDAPALRVHLVRYEDLCADPVAAFGRVAAFLDGEADPERVRRAVAETAFERLRSMDSAMGERSVFSQGRARPAAPFFRRGRPGAGREALSAAQAARLVAAHGDTMRRFGYLDDAVH